MLFTKADIPTACTIDESRCGKSGIKLSLIFLRPFRRIVETVALGVALACSGCDRSSPQARKEKPKQSVDTPSSSSAKKDNRKKPYHREGYAVWYAVPVDSLPSRRAKKDEFTAAHDHLPLGSVVRVTHLANGKSVIVRITDRGVTKRGATIDLCKEAAEKLEMISEGMARVRLEELPDGTGMDAVPDSKATASHR
jgi:peptidoglycan lytic transglycosylase